MPRTHLSGLLAVLVVGVWAMSAAADGEWAPEPETQAASDTSTHFGQACCAYTPQWTVQADALILDRTAAGPIPLVDNGGATEFAASDIHFDHAAGPRLALLHHGASNWDVEFVYFGIDGWGEDVVAGSPGSGFIGFGIGLVDAPYAFDYRSQLDSAEVNLRRRTWGPVNWFAGFRYVELDERFLVSSSGLAGAVDARVINHLWGVQLGADAVVWDGGDRLRVDWVGKAGIYHNDGDYRAIRGLTGTGARSERDETSFVGEIGLVGVYELTTDLSLRGGYQLLWLDGVALAPNQSPATNLPVGSAHVRFDDGIFYHGALVGVELRR